MNKLTTEVRTFTGRGKDGHREKLYTFINRNEAGEIVSVRYQVDKMVTQVPRTRKILCLLTARG